jgi:2-polyprenyl-3-methyl-5-hydroxy-6-metoxy-1,4-benzoquinol methylase
MKTALFRLAPRCHVTSFTEDELLELWYHTIDPEGIGPAEAIAGDIGSCTGEPVTEVLERMAHGRDDFKRLWEHVGVDPTDAGSVAAFYREQFTEAYELAEWHCGRSNGMPPLNYARAALFAQRNDLHRVLDFGSGIGSGSLCLAKVGCEVHSADVALQLLELVEHRLRRHGYQPDTIDLGSEEPQQGYYDLITCFDVLEHIPDQLATLRRLESYLRVGGYLYVNLMDDATDDERPMHISSAGRWLRLVRQTGLKPEWSSCCGQSQMLVRKPAGRLRNRAAGWIDRLQGV